MKIKLLKNWKNNSGREIKKGAEFTVTNDLGIDLVKRKIAKSAGPSMVEKAQDILRKRYKTGADEDPEDGDKGS